MTRHALPPHLLTGLALAANLLLGGCGSDSDPGILDYASAASSAAAATAAASRTAKAAAVSTSSAGSGSSSATASQTSDSLPAGRYVIVNALSGKCVDVAGASQADGGNIQQASCNGNAAQLFDLTQPTAGVYALANVGSGKRVDVSGASTAAGANIQQWSDNGSGAQRFRLGRTQGNRYVLTNVNSNQCVDVASASLADGANVQQWSCNGSGAQQFLFYPATTSGRGALAVGQYSVAAASSHLCLAINGASTDNGALAVQDTCNGTAVQRFDVLPDTGLSYRLVDDRSHLSLDVQGVSAANGALLTQWAATDADNQRFLIKAADGAYQVAARHSGRCLDVRDWSNAAGASVQQWDCASQANQRWSFTPTASSGPADPASPGSGWKLVWQDEFDGSALDAGKWNFEVNGGGGGNNELQYYTDRPQNAFVANGLLTIQAQAEHYCGADGCREYTSARLNSASKGDWLYGRMEVRARLPGGQGLWPAIWMLPTDWAYGGWPVSGEIDMMEAVNAGAAGGNTVYGTLHYGGLGSAHDSKGGNVAPAASITDDFHVYAVEWEATQIRFYVDGALYYTGSNWWSAGGAFPAPFDKRFHMLLNVAVGGNWPGAPDGGTRFPKRMEVDYVRVYQRP